jgi:hypothetical protein
MPNHYFTNFSSGVLTRKLDTRVDFQKYFDGARTLENVIVLPQGGVIKRGGTKYVAETETSSEDSILVPFYYSTTQAYILEFGDEYIRFYKDNGQILDGANPYEVATTYTEAQLSQLRFTQSADYLYIAHPDHAPAKLTRSGHTSWTLSTISFEPPATVLQSLYPSTTVTPSAVSGTGITLTAGAAAFLEGDIGRTVIAGTAQAVITAFTDTTHVTADVLSNFPDTDPITATNWYIYGSPSGSLNPSDSPTNKGSIISLVNSVDAFRSGDVGDYIYVNGGLVKITSYTNATTVKGKIIELIDDQTDATNIWSLEEAAWNSTNGYPSTVQFYEQRLCWAGTSQYPQTIWMSKTGDFENMATGDEDDDAISVTMASARVNAIRWLNEGSVLQIGTTGSEWTLGAQSTTDGVTPTNIRIKQQSDKGSADIDSIQIGKGTFFIHRASRKIYVFGYDWQSDGFKGDEISILAEHLFSDTSIVCTSYQQQPFSCLWVITADGNLHSLTFLENQNIYAWSTHTTNGDFKWIATIPGTNTDELWMIVERTVDGSTVKYVEYMVDPEMDTEEDMFYVDCGATYDSTPATTITGLDHLEGEDVAVLADGVTVTGKTVSSGEIELDAAASVVHIGLSYSATIETIDVPVGSGIIRNIKEINAKFFKTSDASYGSNSTNLGDIAFSSYYGTTPYIGNCELTFPGTWDQDQTIYVKSSNPLSMCLSGILVKFQ